ncbi:MAG: serine/threonine protein kinase [Muribaculaceae bacterium]|nr:serine/threonine protein kinase [Muribaculaceae bacterium]
MAEGKKFEQALPVGFKLTGGSHVYTIEQVLGQGGFGITYKVKARIMAGNIAVTTHFAVKEFFPSNCWRNEGSTQMLYSPTTKVEMEACLKDFVAEGQRLQRICSINSNIVRVNEVFEANNTAYFVMEYLSGGDLRKMVKYNGGGVSEATMLGIITPIANAIQCLHDNHMLHLDLKPENIVMRQSDEGGPDVPVLIDFGISVHFTNDGAPTTTRPSKGVTQGYSPMEQFAGVTRFDPRLDIYSLAATCYFLLTGRDPKSAFDINAGIIAADLHGRASKVTIDNIVRGMSKDFNNRPATVRQFMSGFVANAPQNVANATMRQNYVAPQSAPESSNTRIVSGGYRQPEYSYPGNSYNSEPKRKSKRGLIIALSALATILVLGLAAWGVIALTSGNSRSKGGHSRDDDDKSLQYAIENEDFKLLKKYAEKDSARAFYPLALLYEEKDNYDEALKWAKAALYCNELSDSEQRKANKLIDKLSNARDAENYYSSMADDEFYEDSVAAP